MRSSGSGSQTSYSFINSKEKVISAEEQERRNKPSLDINTLSPEKRRVLETLDLLEKELKIYEQVRHKNDERLTTLKQQLQGACIRFKQLGDDARFSSAPKDLQCDIDDCRATVANATGVLLGILPILKAEQVERRAEELTQRHEREKQKLLEEVLEQQHQASLKAEKAKQEGAERQRVALSLLPTKPQPIPISSSPSSASSSGTGCILPVLAVLGIVAFLAILPFLI